MCELLVDTDVLIKLALYGLLDDVMHAGCVAGCTQRTGIITAAAFVARQRIGRQAVNASAANAHLETSLRTIVSLEPTEGELSLAAEFEAEANLIGVDLDNGESQLCAIALSRGDPIVLTGDKRALVALERLLPRIAELLRLTHRIACLEQALRVIVQRRGAKAVRDSVVAEPTADKATSICFRATSEVVPDDFDPEGLDSYIEAIRRDAPSMLISGRQLDLSAVPQKHGEGSEHGCAKPDS